MVFIAIRVADRLSPGETHVPAKPPQRVRRSVGGPPAESHTGLDWRAIVHVQDRESVRTEWHMANCLAPGESDAHCAEGQRLIAQVGQPDGHCLVGGRCARCEEQERTRTGSPS